MRHEFIRYRVPFVLSLIAGMALWETVGRHTSAAFMVPLSTTLVRLWSMVASGQLVSQFLNSRHCS